jgi:hypothetical protein
MMPSIPFLFQTRTVKNFGNALKVYLIYFDVLRDYILIPNKIFAIGVRMPDVMKIVTMRKIVTVRKVVTVGITAIVHQVRALQNPWKIENKIIIFN